MLSPAMGGGGALARCVRVGEDVSQRDIRCGNELCGRFIHSVVKRHKRY